MRRPADLRAEAHELHFGSVVVDAHADTLGRVVDRGEDLTRRTRGHVDLPRMREGGLGAQFFACWIEPGHVKAGTCVRRTLDLLDGLHRLGRDAGGRFVVARSASEVRRAAAAGVTAGIPCIEGGHAIENDLAVLRMFAALGVRYMTLTWNNSNDWADSCAERPRHDGLTGFGREVVREMNRTGVMVDLSHVHERTFWAALAATRRPVIVSHSCARALCDHRRNLRDGQLRAVARNGGVVCVNFYSGFVSPAFLGRASELDRALEREERRARGGAKALARLHERYGRRLRRLPRPPLCELVDHVDHIAKVAGADHVGLGSDFDGVSSLPEGMDDCGRLPVLTLALRERGWSPRDVRKILGGNVLRVMEANEP